jgi:hypothetical protein
MVARATPDDVSLDLEADIAPLWGGNPHSSRNLWTVDREVLVPNCIPSRVVQQVVEHLHVPVADRLANIVSAR